MTAPVAIVMGSQSDWATMSRAAEALDKLGVAHDARIVSAHRTPQRLQPTKQIYWQIYTLNCRVL